MLFLFPLDSLDMIRYAPIMMIDPHTKERIMTQGESQCSKS